MSKDDLATTGTDLDLSVQALHRMENLFTQIGDLHQVRIHESELAQRKTGRPKVLHVRRWFHTKKYHMRMQAQLTAAHGYQMEPCLYLVNPAVLREQRNPDGFHLLPIGRDQPYIVVHPLLRGQLDQAINNGSVSAFIVNHMGSPK